jgi:hypothetical protein
MKNLKSPHYLLCLLIHTRTLRAASNQNGYAMLITSILAILVFSLLSVYLFSTDLYKSVASQVVDSGTTFYAAESALNKRANITRQRFEAYQLPTGQSPTGNTTYEQMLSCISGDPARIGNGDLGCVTPGAVQSTSVTESDGSIKYKESAVKLNDNSFLEYRKSNDNIKYKTYTFLRDVTKYDPANPGQVFTSVVGASEPFAGLNMLDYRYRVYASSAKEVNNGSNPKDIAAQTMLQMEFSNRLIPIFQFAAFYEKDMEITSSSAMNIGGPIHSNGALRLAPGGILTLNNKATAASGIFKGLQYQATFGGTTPGKSIALANGSSIDVSNAWNTSGINAPVTAAQITASDKQLIPDAQKLELPDAGDLNRNGIYAQKSDFSVDFTPLNANRPFTAKALGRDLTTAELQSLRQPVLAILNARNGDNKAGERVTLCPSFYASETEVPTPTPALTPVQQGNLRSAMQAEMLAWIQANPSSPTAYSSLNVIPSSGVRTSLQNRSGITIGSWTWHQMAKLTGDCWLPAPMKRLDNQPDRREVTANVVRNITILQADIKSLAVWNRDGQTLNGTVLSAVNNPLYVRAAADTSTLADAATGYTMGEMALGSIDNTEGGMVWHFSVDKCSGSGNNTKVNCYPAGQSIYGFGFTNGKRLPGALSLVTDQAAYVQGDFNDARNFSGTGTLISTVPAWVPGSRIAMQKKPAAIMADTIAVLSNSCLDPSRTSNQFLNCFSLNGTTIRSGSSTGINAAFLSRTDDTVVSGTTMVRNSGGLNNYMRMIELWGNNVLTYNGSLVSLGAPVEFSGKYLPGITGGTNTNTPSGANYYYYTIPTRNFSYDKSFNNMAELPPMTPRAIYLKQKVFKRDYDASDRAK